MNVVSLVGNLATDVTLRKVVVVNGDGRREINIASFLLAVNRPRRNGDSGADFVRVETWGRTADVASQYLTKGRRIAVVGRLRSSRFQSQDGTSRYDLRVVARQLQFLSPRKDAAQVEEPAEPEQATEELPF